jgi:hypothetical protein
MEAPRIPRIRPIFIFALLLVAGVVLLRHGAQHGWFVGWPGAETFPQLSHRLWWMGLGLVYGLACVGIWILLGLGRGLGRREVWVGNLVALALLLGGSQVAATHARGRPASGQVLRYLAVKGVRWDPKEQEFVVDLMGPPGVARGFRRGTCRAKVEILGMGGPRGFGSIASRCPPIYPIRVDEETLREASRPKPPGDEVHPGDTFPVRGGGGYLVDIGEIRVPWDRKESAKVLRWLEVFPEDRAVLYHMISVTAELWDGDGGRAGLATRTDFSMAWEIRIR